MGVHNTTGAANTLFIALATIVGMTLYRVYCLAVGNQGRGSGRQGGLIRGGGWYAVDISMVLNAMIRGRGVTDLARMQQCAPPMPTKKEVYSFMDSWYKTHDFSRCVLVFTFDGRRCPYKIRNTVSRQERESAIRARDAAKTYQELERELKKLVTIDADMIYWIRQWVKDRYYDNKVMMFGAPYEADAQMVQLERQGIVDGIITDDGSFVYVPPPRTYTRAHVTTMHAVDAWFLGGQNILKGFTTRKQGPYSAILGGTVRTNACRTLHSIQY